MKRIMLRNSHDLKHTWTCSSCACAAPIPSSIYHFLLTYTYLLSSLCYSSISSASRHHLWIIPGSKIGMYSVDESITDSSNVQPSSCSASRMSSQFSPSEHTVPLDAVCGLSQNFLPGRTRPACMHAQALAPQEISASWAVLSFVISLAARSPFVRLPLYVMLPMDPERPAS